MHDVVEMLDRVLGARAERERERERVVHVPRRLRPRHARATFVPVSDRLLARWLAH